MFQSPCGVMVLQRYKQSHKPKHCSWFQSPCGVMVLQHAFYAFTQQLVSQRFSPLAGLWSCNQLVQDGEDLAIISCFSPLAGLWSCNMSKLTMASVEMLVFQSPCGVMVLQHLVQEVLPSISFRGQISIGHFSVNKCSFICKKQETKKPEILMERATSRGQRNNAVFKDRATYGGNVFNHRDRSHHLARQSLNNVILWWRLGQITTNR